MHFILFLLQLVLEKGEDGESVIGQSMMNLRLTKRKKMFLIQSLCLLGTLDLFVHKIHALMQSFRSSTKKFELKTLASQSYPEAGPSRL